MNDNNYNIFFRNEEADASAFIDTDTAMMSVSLLMLIIIPIFVLIVALFAICKTCCKPRSKATKSRDLLGMSADYSDSDVESWNTDFSDHA